jgi:hypothetical protein
MVEASIALLNLAVITAVLGQIGVRTFGGVTSVTVGGVTTHDTEVVKVHTLFAGRGSPNLFAAPVVIVAV